jgi:hypothetical protein
MTPFDLPDNYLDLLCYDPHRHAEVREAYISRRSMTSIMSTITSRGGAAMSL